MSLHRASGIIWYTCRRRKCHVQKSRMSLCVILRYYNNFLPGCGKPYSKNFISIWWVVDWHITIYLEKFHSSTTSETFTHVILSINATVDFPSLFFGFKHPSCLSNSLLRSNFCCRYEVAVLKNDLIPSIDLFCFSACRALSAFQVPSPITISLSASWSLVSVHSIEASSAPYFFSVPCGFKNLLISFKRMSHKLS